MENNQHFLDADGVKYLYSALSLQDYPNNDILSAILEAIDKTKVNKDDLLNSIYPIGSIYISVNINSPEELFGGKWEQIKDTFLLAAGNSYQADTTGGSAKITLSLDQIPARVSKKEAEGYGLEQATAFMDRVLVEDSYGSKSINILPPYLTVYMWKRIS